jgi:hypothetical protein
MASRSQQSSAKATRTLSPLSQPISKLTRLLRSFKAERADERIEIIDDALIEAIELRPLLLVDPSICSKGAENAGG